MRQECGKYPYVFRVLMSARMRVSVFGVRVYTYILESFNHPDDALYLLAPKSLQSNRVTKLGLGWSQSWQIRGLNLPCLDPSHLKASHSVNRISIELLKLSGRLEDAGLTELTEEIAKEDRLLTVAEAAVRLGCGRRTLDQMISDRRIPDHLIGGRYRFDKLEVLKETKLGS